eukprot:TRINITY_DN3139_c0_g1_i7.p2 TRINITY_DN3139_c0_g1~~TRINITY_DN3139_c0_g1_i7.p2  ORF type:complete len:123 (-),score=11.07 TRINITY_DN3139_c0_g1_i7:537-905(-)
MKKKSFVSMQRQFVQNLKCVNFLRNWKCLSDFRQFSDVIGNKVPNQESNQKIDLTKQLQEQTEENLRKLVENSSRLNVTSNQNQSEDIPKKEDDESDEIDGPKGLEPTRFGDWERNGRCTDF